MNESNSHARCRLCTANDIDGIIENVAAELWESRRDGTLDDRAWADAGEMWQKVFRDFAATAVGAMSATRIA